MKSSILLAAVIILAISTTGSLVWGFTKSGGNNSNQSTMPGNLQDQNYSNRGGSSDMGGPRGGMNFNVKQFFNDDGSVNNDKVKSFLSSMPSRGNSSSSGPNMTNRFEEMINQAASDGTITQDQADALTKAFESESSSS